MPRLSMSCRSRVLFRLVPGAGAGPTLNTNLQLRCAKGATHCNSPLRNLARMQTCHWRLSIAAFVHMIVWASAHLLSHTPRRISGRESQR